MDELKDKIKMFVRRETCVTIPQIQAQFGLNYRQVTQIFKELCDESFLAFSEGLTYKIIPIPENYERGDDGESEGEKKPVAYTFDSFFKRTRKEESDEDEEENSDEDDDSEEEDDFGEEDQSDEDDPEENDESEEEQDPFVSYRSIVEARRQLMESRNKLEFELWKAQLLAKSLKGNTEEDEDGEAEEDENGDPEEEEEEQTETYSTSAADERLIIKILDYGINCGYLTSARIAGNFACGYVKASQILEALTRRGYIEKIDFRYKVLMGRGEFSRLFGSDTVIEGLLTKINQRYADGGIDDKKKKAVNKNYKLMLKPKFNMAEAISATPNVDAAAMKLISSAKRSPSIVGGEWHEDKNFTAICMEIIQSIAAKSQRWERSDALHEAARQLAAVQETKQSRDVCNVHSRVMYEFLYAREDEYETLKRHIFRWRN